jgi:hypothetical protein
MTEYHPYEQAPGVPILGTGGAPRADYLTQATSIEQTRVVSETLAQVTVAQQRRRNEEDALAKMLRSTKLPSLADKAFFEYPKGGAIIRDLTIGAVKEMARCWTNMQYAVIELSQDLGAGVSEMLAWAWDMEANNYVRRIKVVPHVRDTKKDGRKRITDFREIGEILGNWAARQLRTCIVDVLPPWYVDEVKKGFEETETRGLKDKPIEVIRANAIRTYGDDFQVSREQLETFLDRNTNKWSLHDVARLRSLHGALKRGEQRVDDVFEPETLKPEDVDQAPVDPNTAATIQAMTVKAPAPAPAGAQSAPDVTGEDRAAGVLFVQITEQLRQLEIDPDTEPDDLDVISLLAGVPRGTTLTNDQLIEVNNRLASILGTSDPGNELAAVLDAARLELADEQGDNPT